MQHQRDLTEFYGAYPFPALGFEGNTDYLDFIIRDVRRVMDPDTNGVWLDVGCGTGEIVCLMAEAFPGLRFHGVDLSQQSLDLARKHAEMRGVSDRITLESLDATSADFNELLGGEKAAVISGIGSLHYLPNMEEVVHRLFQCVRADGLFLLGVYGLQGRWRQEQLRQAIFTLLPNNSDFAERQRLLIEELLPHYRDLPVFKFLEQNFGGIENVPDQWWQDTFLVPYERQFPAEKCYDLLQECGARSIAWLNEPGIDGVVQGEEWRSRVAQLPQRDRTRILDRIAEPSFHYFAGSPSADLAVRIAAQAE